ncbi:MAG: HAMP domain-containing histidine kinase [Acidobacteria bacterium]|nr:HAMP domain-containing histidine kinase [Acidobacteriota bacterium]
MADAADPVAASDLSLDGLVHDLNNIFENLLQTSELLARDAKYAKAAASLQRNITQGQRILTSYFEQSQASLELETILDQATDFARDFVRLKRGTQIEFERRLEEGVRLCGNPAAWERVFMNLFLNAAQALEGDGVVEIAAARTARGVEITVSDNGPGISPKILPRVFEPGVSTRAKRSGLGLHIVKSLVEQFGGTVEAANRPNGQGAMFLIVLPQQGGLAGGEGD